MTRITDQDVVEGLISGALTSPQSFYGNKFFLIRLSGTGVQFRPARGEFVVRDAKLWLTDQMARRWAGVPVIVQHPADGVLDTDAFRRTVVGCVARAFVRDSELWGVVRIVDERAAELMTELGGDTSPSVLFDSDDIEPVKLADGALVLVEREPTFVDHIALVEKGVWSQGTGEPGVETEKETEA